MKRLLSLFSILLAFCLLSTTTLAANLGTLTVWNSGDSTIGRWNKSSIKVYVVKLNLNDYFYFGSSMSHGCTQWSNALGITITSSSSSSYSSAPIKFHGGTVDEINDYGSFTADSTTNGLSLRTSVSTEGTWTYNGTSKSGKLISAAIGCVVDRSRTLAQYKKTSTHELGHCLGWYGHSSNSSDIMYSAGSSVTTLTNRDKKHLSQVYD